MAVESPQSAGSRFGSSLSQETWQSSTCLVGGSIGRSRRSQRV